MQLASSIVPARTPKPILQCAKLATDPEGKKLTVTATDGEITIRYDVTQVQVVQQGSAVLPADRMAAILHESMDETVDLEVTDATCQVVCRDSRFHVYGHDPDDFPVWQDLEDTPAVQIDAPRLRRMIHMTSFAAARENTRYAINGVLWEQTGKKLRMVATDGRRLALMDGAVTPAAAETEQTAIVPVKAWSVLEKVLNEPEEVIQIRIQANQMAARTSLMEITCNLVQGRFPKYTDVVPTGTTHRVQVPVEAFRSAVRRAALLNNEQSRGILLSFSPGALCLTSSTPEAGDAEVNMPVDYQGEPLEIGFNPQYLLDALRVVAEPEITLEFIESTKPGLMRAGKDFSYVVMPVTV
ncbi:MAG: DNA polymerase III subunit beta [Sedimentisphaerales bacterium]|nr:DNA polymerase III subunit beta [Sedimentisphaerales bacterium]